MNLQLILILIINFAIYTFALKALRSGDQPDEQIINGYTPGRNDNPHVLQLEVTFSDRVQSCTGTLISRSWALTAGHCTKNARSIKVNLGMFSRTEGPTQIINVPARDIFPHPNFSSSTTDNGTTYINDIGLLRLNPRADVLQRNIGSIPIACATFNDFSGREGKLCGWGITSEAATNITNTIQCVDMPIITNTECKRTWGVNIRPTNICTRTVGSHTGCRGDSGGPLVALSGILQRQKLVGIVSFISKPCVGTSPNVFTRITSYTDWIFRTSGVPCDFL